MKIYRVASFYDSWLVMLDGNKHYRLYKDRVMLMADNEYRDLLVFLEELATRTEIEPQELLDRGFTESVN